MFKKITEYKKAANAPQIDIKAQIAELYERINADITSAKKSLNNANAALEMLSAGSVKTAANLKDLDAYRSFTEDKLKTLTTGATLSTPPKPQAEPTAPTA